MRIFVTGATGFIGSAIVHELLGGGHQVVGLSRNKEAADKLAGWGAQAHQGDLSDTDNLASGARQCDGVIHTAFGHDFSKYKEAGETDRLVVDAVARALEGSDKPFIITSGTLLLTPGRIGTENDAAAHDSPSAIRTPSEEAAMAAAGKGVRSGIVRLPPSVHGPEDHGFIPAMIDVARKKGFSAFIDDGLNRWPAVNRLDAARLFRLAVEKTGYGTRLHAVAEDGVPVRKIAEAIGEGLGIPVRSIAADEAQAHFDWLAMAVPVDNPTSSDITRQTFGWQPRENGLLQDLRESGYFS